MSDSVPDWITIALLEEHLQKYYENPNIRVLNIDVNLAVGKNQNFSSFIYRAKIKFMVCDQFIQQLNIIIESKFLKSLL